jgi:hypothetical protein
MIVISAGLSSGVESTRILNMGAHISLAATVQNFKDI